jgi:hypothetical protein
VTTRSRQNQPADDDDFELVTHEGMLATAPEPQDVTIKIPELKRNGRAQGFRLVEFTGEDYADFEELNKIRRGGEVVGIDNSHRQEKILAVACRDGKGHPVWSDPMVGVSVLKKFPLPILNRLYNAWAEIGADNAASAEKNSEETSNDSSPSD